MNMTADCDSRIHVTFWHNDGKVISSRGAMNMQRLAMNQQTFPNNSTMILY